MPQPKTLGACIDKACRLQKQIKDLEESIKRIPLAKTLGRIKVQEAEVLSYIGDTFKESELDGASGKVGTVDLIRRENYSVTSKPLLIKFIVANKAFDIFTNKLSSPAIRDRLEQKVKIPGIVKTTSVTIKVKPRG